MNVFKQIAPPAGDRSSGRFPFSAWYSWSDEVRPLLQGNRLHLPHVTEPELIHLGVGKPYDYTFSVAPELIDDAELSRAIHEAATSLFNVEPRQSIMLFADMLGNGIDRRSFQTFFAIVRAILARLDDGSIGAMYAPLGEIGADITDFPLHADLYPLDLLFNVFDEVPDDDSGVSLFMRVSKFLDVLRELSGIPLHVRDNVADCLATRNDEDRFKEFFDLLYADDNPWSGDLKARLAREALQIHFRRGEGYLIHDRWWLHGRTAPTGGVSPYRLHRLAFNSSNSSEAFPQFATSAAV